MSATEPVTLQFAGDGAIPNSRLPVLVYHDVEPAFDAAGAERAFAANDWRGSWRDGIFSFHHFHSTAHEALAIVRGTARVTLGGPQVGRTVEVAPGDVLVLPAGTGHCNEGSNDLLVVGAYPQGMAWDVRRGDPAEYEEVQANIAAVPLPRTDPLHGPDGPLPRLWGPEADG